MELRRRMYSSKRFALRFDGVNDYVNCGLISGGDVQNIGFELNFNYPITANRTNALIHYNGRLVGSGVLLYISTQNSFNVSIYNGTGTIIIPSIPIAAKNTVFVKYTTNGVSAIVNGVTYTGTYQPIIYADTSRLTVFGRISGFASFGNVEMWDVKITELDSNGNYVRTIGHWPFTEGSGQMLADIAGVNNGTIIESTWIEI